MDGWMDSFEGLESRPLLGTSLSLGQVHWHQYIYAMRVNLGFRV
jgi:hypothetical protein